MPISFIVSLNKDDGINIIPNSSNKQTIITVTGGLNLSAILCPFLEVMLLYQFVFPAAYNYAITNFN